MIVIRPSISGCLRSLIGTTTNTSTGILSSASVCCHQERFISKHWNPKYKKLRAQKFIKVELPDYDQKRREDRMTPEEMRAKMKEKGIIPPRPWIERPINISCTGGIFEPYIPPEGDGKISLVSMPGAKQRFEVLEKKGKSMLAIRKIRKFDDDFNHKLFADKAQEIYIEAHKTLMDRSSEAEDKLHDLLTEKCFPEMRDGMATKTLRWSFVESLELPRVVHARCTDVISKENVYAQVTVRMHTRQTLAIYDRFGRLMYGNEAMAKDTLEYIVMEKHLSNVYGSWRIHAKIIPSWQPPVDAFPKTFIKPSPKVADIEPTKDTVTESVTSDQKEIPSLATV